MPNKITGYTAYSIFTLTHTCTHEHKCVHTHDVGDQYSPIRTQTFQFTIS